MNIEELREFCLNLEFTTEEVLWDGVLVFKVGGKMFCFAPLDENLKMNLKCDPDEALELRERFPAVLPGYHMNKRTWLTVRLDGSVPFGEIAPLIARSYELAGKK